MKLIHFLGFLSITLVPVVTGFPAYQSLAGLPVKELERDFIVSKLQVRQSEPPPGPLDDTSTKLVNDKDHPFNPPQPGDIRGPCPGLNTAANHGYLPHNGIATPAQIVDAVQNAFNMANDLAVFTAYAAMLVDGNLITNQISIGGKSPETGPDPPLPATAGGLGTHNVFEGDTSMTRGDSFFGDNMIFNESLFEEFSDFSIRLGAGKYNATVGAELRFQRIQDSIANNPEFSYNIPRFFTAYFESAFPTLFFVDGRELDGQLDLTVARGFFQDNSMPNDFFRANRSMSFTDISDALDIIYNAHPVQPGKNQNGINTYTIDPVLSNITPTDRCALYTGLVNETVPSLYPSPSGELRDALNHNLEIYYSPLKGSGCNQLFPFGQ